MYDMLGKVQKFVKFCDICQRTKVKQRGNKPYQVGISLPNDPFQWLSVDIVTFGMMIRHHDIMTLHFTLTLC